GTPKRNSLRLITRSQSAIPQLVSQSAISQRSAMPFVRSPYSRANQVRDPLTNRLRFQDRSVSRLHSLPISRRPHHNQSSERHQRSPKPNPPDERIERHPNLRRIRAPHSRKHHIHVLPESSLDPDLSRQPECLSPTRIDVLALPTGNAAGGFSFA